MQKLDLISLFSNLFLLVCNLLLQGCADGSLPLLLPPLFHRLMVLLDPFIAGISRIPDETVWFHRHSRKLWLRNSLHTRRQNLLGGSLAHKDPG